jgi:hypothetical protein
MNQLFRDRTRSAKRLVWHLGRLSRKAKEKSKEVQEGYRELIQITGASVRQAQTVKEILASWGQEGAEKMRKEVRKLQVELERFLPLRAASVGWPPSVKPTLAAGPRTSSRQAFCRSVSPLTNKTSCRSVYKTLKES